MRFEEGPGTGEAYQSEQILNEWTDYTHHRHLAYLIQFKHNIIYDSLTDTRRLKKLLRSLLNRDIHSPIESYRKLRSIPGHLPTFLVLVEYVFIVNTECSRTVCRVEEFALFFLGWELLDGAEEGRREMISIVGAKVVV